MTHARTPENRRSSTLHPPPPGRWVRVAGWALLFLAWGCGVAAGFVVLAEHEFTPAGRIPARATWPCDALGAQAAGGPTLVLFAHPQCPCTRATLSELERVATACRGGLHIRVLFRPDPDGSESGVGASLRDRAAAIPGIEIGEDTTGSMARAFGARTSGECFLYSEGGRLLFSGGITASRGHEGASAGSGAVIASVLGRLAPIESAPVFGCSLFDEPEEPSLP